MEKDPTDIRELEGYDEMQRKFLDSLTPSERLAGLGAAERLAGLTPDEIIDGLPEPLRAALRRGLSRD